MARIQKARNDVSRAERALQRRLADYYREVAELVDEVGGPEAARRLGLSTQRIYQLRAKHLRGTGRS